MHATQERLATLAPPGNPRIDQAAPPQVEAPKLSPVQQVLKRGLDILGAGLGLIILAPIFLLVAIAIKLNSAGPVFFCQRRPGHGGGQFKMWKFRSMRMDAEELLQADPALHRRFLENDCKLPLEEDPRVFPVGRWLRSTSLDELPQLINVIRGEMSLVGPRPVVGPELERYGERLELFQSVKPGMTGYWQINGRSEVPYPERADMDIYYVQHQSFLLDLKILLLTIPAVLSRRGAH